MIMSPDKLKRILSLRSRGLSYAEIAEMTVCSKATVARTLKDREGFPVTNVGGRPKKIPEHLNSRILEGFVKGRIKTCFEAKKYVEKKLNISLSRETIRRSLVKSGLKCYSKIKKPRLLPRHKTGRFSFATAMVHQENSYWEKMVFTDESKFNLHGPDGFKKVWHFPGCKIQDHHIRPVVKFGGGNVMVWGAITYRGVGKLVFINGRMDSQQFIEVLSLGYNETLAMHGYEQGEMILQQDNDPKHTSRLTKEWLDENRIQTFEVAKLFARHESH